MRPKLSDIARLSNVSIATASYVLNGKAEDKGISDATTQRILEMARQQGYVPNRTAGFLKHGRYHLIALMAPHIADFYADLLRCIETEAEKRDYQILFSSTFDSVEREKSYIGSLLSRRIDGLIILPVDINGKHLQVLQRHRLPTVFFRRRAGSELPHKFMTFDDFEVGYLAARHLIERGCRRLVFLSAPVFMEMDYLKIIHEARFTGCAKAAHEAGLSFGPENLHVYEPSNQDDIQRLPEVIQRLAPDGVVGLNDELCIWLMHLLHLRGIAIPETIRFAGCDDTAPARMSIPSLTSVAFPKPELGGAMVQSLFHMMDNHTQETGEVLLRPHLVERRSSGPQPPGKASS